MNETIDFILELVSKVESDNIDKIQTPQAKIDFVNYIENVKDMLEAIELILANEVK